MANKDVFDEKMEALADAINAKAGTSGALTLDGMKSAVDAIELGSEVIANPTLEGGEDDLTSIEIDGTKYAIPEGSSVEANPTLAGTEADLVGIEVDGTKYKVPKGAYIATNTNDTTISSASHDYIVANWRNVPCFFGYGVDRRLFRVTDVDGRTIHANSPIMDGETLGQTKLIYASIGSTSDTIYIDTIYINAITANPGNPTTDLTSLKVRNVTYRIPQGTEVTANPTLAGTESDLTGLEVDGTKYKVPSDYLPLAGGTMSGDIDLVGNKLVGSIGSSKYNLINLSRGGAIYIGDERPNDIIIETSSIGSITHRKGAYGDTPILDGLNTSANPAITGNENTLTSLQVASVKYKVRDGINNGLGYLTTAPTADNTDGIKIVVLSAEPATKYAGYLYIITA